MSGWNRWTEDRVEALKRLWADGYSASQIAAELGGVTKNGVIGKVHRLGLSGRVKPTAPSARKGPRRAKRPKLTIVESREAVPEVPVSGPNPEAPCAAVAPAIEHVAETAAELPEDAFAGPSGAVDAVLSLKRGECKFPIGSPADMSFGFCGAPQVPGQVYCEHHCRIAYPNWGQVKLDKRRKKQDPEIVAKRLAAAARTKARQARVDAEHSAKRAGAR